MFEFINYKSRSVALPPGCKDLIDLLRPAGLPKAEAVVSTDEHSVVTRGESVTARMPEIGKYVARVFHAPGKMVIVLMSTVDEQFTINLSRDQSATIAAHVVFGHSADRERAMRTFCQRHGLNTLPDSGIHEVFSPHLPVHSIHHVSPLPSEPESLSDMVTELFRDVCGLDDTAEIHFHCYVVTNAT